MNFKFFKMVEAAAFTNPFSDERVEIDRQIVGAPLNAGWDEMQVPLFQALEEGLQGIGDVKRLIMAPRSDRVARSVTVCILFYAYTRVQDQFDELIDDQISAGNDVCKAPFAFECMKLLEQYGFGRAEACRYVGIFYQIRRAYFFISRGLIGESTCMKRLRAQLWNNIFTHDIFWYEQCLWNRMEDFSTLLLGETGTGKGAAAAAIGRSGFIPFNPSTQKFEESFTRAFISINLSQYSEALIESELFGHCQGAFTGAIEKHVGIFARCSPHGAIFLDEIGEVSEPIQIKLLQVLQERTFSPVGSHEKLRFKGRVIAATNQSIDVLRREGKFRDDFYYRLCSDLITVPPLRQRIREDLNELDILCRHIMLRICGDGDRLPVVDILKKKCGRHYAWPGNVRELEQAIRRIMLTGSYDGGCPDDSPEELSFYDAMDMGALTAQDLVQKYCRDLYDTHGNYGEVARRTGLDWRTVKRYIGSLD